MKIGVVATGSRLEPALADKVAALAAAHAKEAEIVFHPQCFLSSGHFAGADEARAKAFLEIANDESFDALWFARGGYGSCRLNELILPKLGAGARKKIYLGYSDSGALMGPMYRLGFSKLAYGPMPSDMARENGEAAIRRALDFLVRQSPDTLEANVSPSAMTAAFNLTILCTLIGTPFQPDLARHVLMLEEVAEYMYRIDRAMFQLTSNADIRKVAGIRLGRCSLIPDNNPDFKQTEEEVVKRWCKTSGIPYLGRADIGHDIGNKIVPFGRPWFETARTA
jgi:muramoyltetrapeptide carboxypeptidase